MLLIVHRKADPTDAEWDAWLGLIGGTDRSDYDAMLAVTEGGGPNARQRQRLAELWKDRRISRPLALLTPSAFARGIMTALHWIGVTPNQMRAFAPAQRAEAFAFMGVGPETEHVVLARAWELLAELARESGEEAKQAASR